MNPEYYSWNGVPVEVDVFDTREYDSRIDVSAYMDPRHDTGKVPEGEVHYLIRLPGNKGGWWVEGEELFWEYAKPLSPNAIERYEERDT